MSNREFPPAADRAAAHQLRNNICRLDSPASMAGVASHLRGYAVAECIALTGRLDSHPQIVGKPTIAKCGAVAQSMRGTVPNPLAHALPSSFLINGKKPTHFFDSTEARSFVARVLGMGVIAPADWSERRLPVHGRPAWRSGTKPVQVNRTHIGVEGYRRAIKSEEEESRGSLVHAVTRTIAEAAKRGTWNASGTDQFNETSLVDFVTELYRTVWRPLALVAYNTARIKLDLKRSKASGQRLEVLEGRSAILAEDLRVFMSDSPNLREATRQTIARTAGEQWRQ